MKIVFDCFKLIKGVGKSIGIYNLSLNLVKNLSVEHELIVFGNEYNEKDFNINKVNFIKITDFNPESKKDCLIWELYEVSRKAKKINADKIVFPRGFCSLLHPVEDIIIIHDMIPFYYNEKFPKYFNRIENLYIMYRLKQSARTCKKIITISDESKNDIIKYTNVSENKISVIYNGINNVNISSEKKENYICAITSKLPHKNYDGIMKAYNEYLNISKNPLNLKIIGYDGINTDKISFYKYIENENELYSIIKKARLFLFLSLKEGFGFPPIEAMQLGTPVITSNISSIPEIVGDAAILVNPNNNKQIASQIENVCINEKLQAKLIELGYQNIKRFNWENISKEYWAAITR